MTDYTQYAATQHPSVTPQVPDLETQATGQEPQDLRLWLRTEFQTTLPRFDLMSQLTHATKGLKMSELSRLMMVTNGNITGLTDQLEKDGLVERLKDDTDRRSSLIRLTLKGRRYHRRMQRAHASWIQSLLGGLAPAARATLFDLLGDLKQSTYARLPAA